MVTAFSTLKFSRDDFAPDFIFGSGASAYQVEGAAFQDGRTPRIWHTFTHAGNVHGDTGDIACDEYHKYKVRRCQLMVDTGLDAYRFSISWSRIIPDGRGPVNPKGLAYYNNLINELINHGIQPHVTLFHIDLPQVLEDEYGAGRDFTEYADVCFREFGDRVLYWTTVNEGNVVALGGFVDALVFGDYPDIVKKRAGTRIPAFTKQESKQVEGSFDFIGINHYNTLSIKNNPEKLKMDHRDFNADVGVDTIFMQGDSLPQQLPLRAWALQAVLEYFKQFYGNPPIYIHENGQQTPHNASLDDLGRVKYLQNGSNARGYFTWSFLDVLELLDGFRSSYGLYYVDLDDPDLERYPKLSAYWYSGFLKGRNITPDGAIDIKKNKIALSSDQYIQ
ncbi:hypothetical protein AAG906_034862 [Vitis piasezkii]